MANSGLFLDRDGVINHDYGYVHLIKDFKFIDGIFKLVEQAVKKNYKIIVITNQAGIGKGFYTEDTFLELNNWMCGVFSDYGAPISQVYYCPNHPKGIGKYQKSDFRRKPSPGMLLEAQNDFDLDLSSCVLIGDQKTDIEAGLSAGIGCNILFDAGSEDSGFHDLQYLRVSSLLEVIPMI